LASARGGFCAPLAFAAAPAAQTALQYVPVMQQAIEHRAHCGNITQQFAPVFDWSIDVSRVLSRW
jgi:hypothetical protein